MSQRRMKVWIPLLLAVVAMGVVSAGSATAAKPQAPKPTPISVQVEIDGTVVGGFASVSGLRMEIETVEYRDGSSNLVTKLPGRLKFGDVTLERGYVGQTDLFSWISEARSLGPDLKRDVKIRLLNAATKTPIQSFCLLGCFPIKWTATDLNASGNDVAVEELVLSVDDITLE